MGRTGYDPISVILFMSLSPLSLITVIGLLGHIRGRFWGRAVTTFTGALHLLLFPIGTVLAILLFTNMARASARVPDAEENDE